MCATCPQEPDPFSFPTAFAYVEAGLGPTDDPHRARTLLNELGLSGEEDPRISPGRGAPRRAARALAPEPDICCSMSRPIISICLRSNELEAELKATRSALVSSARPQVFAETLRARRSGSIRGRTRTPTAASPSSRPGATKSLRRRSASSIKSIARSSLRSIGCAMASRRGASATRSGSAISDDAHRAPRASESFWRGPACRKRRRESPASSSSKPRR